MTTTVVYYTANKKPQAFAETVRKTLVAHMGDLPLVSVSHEPMDFGTNICVGPQEMSIHNVLRQLQIGAAEARTEAVCTAEDDTIYPPEYFAFRPPDDATFYLADPAYTLYAQRKRIHFFSYNRKGDEGALVVNRRFLIQAIEDLLTGMGMWGPNVRPLHVFRLGHLERFPVDPPVVEIRNDADLHRQCQYDTRNLLQSLPGYGECREMIRHYQVLG